jgi:hypothetical protein
LKELQDSSFQDLWKGPTIIREPVAGGRISEYTMVMKNVFWNIPAWAVWSRLGQIWRLGPGKGLRNPQFSCMHTGRIIPIACSRYGNRDYLKNMVTLYGQSPAAMIKIILSDMGAIGTPEMLKPVEIEHDDINALKTLMHDFGDHF